MITNHGAMHKTVLWRFIATIAGLAAFCLLLSYVIKMFVMSSTLGLTALYCIVVSGYITAKHRLGDDDSELNQCLERPPTLIAKLTMPSVSFVLLIHLLAWAEWILSFPPYASWVAIVAVIIYGICYAAVADS